VHDLDDTDDYEDEGIDVESADEDIDAVDTEQEVSKKNEHKPKKYQKQIFLDNLPVKVCLEFAC
jgi:hypothetical protein